MHERVGTSHVVISHLTKRYDTAQRGELLALRNVSLDVARGEFISIVGPSGCGKSTLLNIVAGLELAGEGQVLCDGAPVCEPGRDRMMMFQESALFPWLDVMDNVLFSLRLKPGLGSAERREVAEFYLKLVGLEKFHRAFVHELSGGMKQRVALARALAPNPRVLLMDEPFAALDALTREQLYGDLQQIWRERKKTILFVTHNVREAVCLGDRVVLFSPHPGRIQDQFMIDLPRLRDINSIDVARHATMITAALKSGGRNGPPQPMGDGI